MKTAYMVAMLALVAVEPSAGLRLPRRALLPLSLSATMAPRPPAFAAEPEPAKSCDDACMEERLRRKREALKNQDRRCKSDAKVLYGAGFQKGVRESTKDTSGLFGFLTPGDVGGVNLNSAPVKFYKDESELHEPTSRVSACM